MELREGRLENTAQHALALQIEHEDIIRRVGPGCTECEELTVSGPVARKQTGPVSPQCLRLAGPTRVPRAHVHPVECRERDLPAVWRPRGVPTAAPRRDPAAGPASEIDTPQISTLCFPDADQCIAATRRQTQSDVLRDVTDMT